MVPVRRRSQAGLVLSAAIIIMAGLGIGLVEMYRLPKASIWGVVGVAIALVAIIRRVWTPRP